MRCLTVGTLTLLATTAGSTSAHAQPLQQSEYIALVLREGLAAKVAEAEAQLVRAQSVGVGAWPNPAIEWQREGASSTGGSPTQDLFRASVPLVLSGRLGLEAAAAALRSEAGALRLTRARSELHREAADRFAAVLAANQRLAILEESLRVISALTQVIATRQKAGDASGYELLRIGIEQAAVETGVAGARIAQQQASSEAMALLAGGEKAVSFEGALPETAGALATALREGRADLKALSLEAEAARADQRAASRGWIPEVVVSGGAQTFGLGEASPGVGYVVGLSVPLPFFQRHQSARAQSIAQENLARTRRALLEHQARQQVAAKLEAVTARALQVERHQAQVLPRAEQLRQVASAAYRGGSAELLMLVDSERTSREARLTFTELQLQLATAQSALQLEAGGFER